MPRLFSLLSFPNPGLRRSPRNAGRKQNMSLMAPRDVDVYQTEASCFAEEMIMPRSRVVSDSPIRSQ